MSLNNSGMSASQIIICWTISECFNCEVKSFEKLLVLLMMMYDLEKASKSAPGISLYVSDDRKVATKF